MPWRRQIGAAQERCDARAIDEADLETRLEHHRVGGANETEETKRLGVAAGEHVLAVVDPLAGLAILPGPGAAAEPPARFEHEHATTGARELHRGGEAGKAAADEGHGCHAPTVVTLGADVTGSRA